MNAGALVNFGAGWLGFHWSGENRRLCVNLVPFVTLWVTAPGGQAPHRGWRLKK